MKDSIFSLFNGKNFTNYFLKFYVTYFKLFYAKKIYSIKLAESIDFFEKKLCKRAITIQTIRTTHNIRSITNTVQL